MVGRELTVTLYPNKWQRDLSNAFDRKFGASHKLLSEAGLTAAMAN